MIDLPPKVTILNVDDNEISCYTKSHVLRRAGFEVKEAMTGTQALKSIKQHRPPLVLLDVGLPDINGLEVCRRIKNDPTLAMTLVLQISASLISSADKARSLEGGADAYLAEPVEPEVLVATVKALLRLRQAESALEDQRTFLRQVIDLNPNFIFAKDRQGRFTLVNQAVADAYGTTVENLIGKTDADFSSNPAEVEHFQQDDLEVMDSQQEKFIPEETITDATGQVRWLQTVKRPIIGEDGLAHQILGVATDITQRKQIQAALTELNETLEQRVNQRTALMRLLQEVATAANEAESVEAALQFALERVCVYTGWPVGHAYWLNRENPDELISSSIWHLDQPERFEKFRQATETTRFTRGTGLPGQVLAKGELTWIENVAKNPVFPRGEAAAESGLTAGFGFPLWVGQEVVAVLEFYSVNIREPDKAFLQAVNQIGTQLGRVVERQRAEKRIRASERRLLEAQQIAHLGSWSWDIPSNKVTWSDELYRIYGLSPQSAEITYEGFLERVHPDDRKRVAKLVQTAYQTGQPFDYEHRVIRPDGTIRTLHAQGKVILSEKGQPLKMVGIGHDITERKEMEEQLRHLNAELEQRVIERTAQLEAANQELSEEISERKQVEQALRQRDQELTDFLENAVVGMHWVEPDGTIIWANKAELEMLGYTAEEYIGHHIAEFHVDQATIDDILQRLARAETLHDYEARLRCKDGSIRYVRVSSNVKWEDGEFIHTRCFTRDITDRRLAQEALRESEARFRTMADTAPVLIWMADAGKQRIYFNKPWLDFTGRTIEQELGFGWTEGVHPDDYDRCLKIYTSAFDAREPFEMEYRLRRTDGEYRWIVDQAVPRFEGEQFVGYIGSCLDIHERKRAELSGRVLAEAGKLLSSSLDPASQLANMAWLAVPHLADWCAVDIYDADWTVHHVAVAHVDPAKVALADEVRRRYPPQREELVKGVHPWQQGESKLYPEITEAMLEEGAQDAEHYQILRDLQLHSAMVVPLIGRERIFGLMAFFWAESGHRYDEQDLALAEELARRAAIALDNAHAYEAEQQARQAAEHTTERITALQTITAAFSQALTSAQVTRVVIDQGVTILGAIGGSLTLLDESETHLEIVDSVGYPADVIEQWRNFPLTLVTPLTEAVRNQEAVYIESREELTIRYPGLAHYKIASYPAGVAVPLSVEGRRLGGLSLSFEEPRAFTPEDCAFILSLAHQCAQALERARLYETEQKARAEAEASQQRLALLAEARERNRLAQELHDTVAQSLGYLNLKMGMTHTLLVDEQIDAVKANLQELKQIIGEVYTDVREEIFNLRAKVLSGMGFMELLDRYIEKYHRFYHLNIQLVQEADPALFEFPGEVSSQLIRTIQEALINIRKHAQVDTATIRLGQDNEALRIVIEDQGQGFDPTKIKEKTNSFGLNIMRERVASVGGSLEVETAPGEGTRIIISYRKP